MSANPEIPAGKRAKKRNLSTVCQYGFNFWLLSRLPLALSRLYLGFLAWLYFLVAGKERRSVKKVLAHSLGQDQGWLARRRLWSKVRSGIVDHYFEKLFMCVRPYPELGKMFLGRLDLGGRQHLDQALAQGKGVILVTGHFGAVEFLPGALSYRGLPVSAMVHCNSSTLRETLERRAGRTGIRLLDPKAGSIFFEALKHLGEGRVLITQCDELDMWHPYPNRGLNFLGHRLGLDRSLDILARKSGAPVIFGLVHRLPGGAYRLEMQPVEPQAGARAERLFSLPCLNLLQTHIYSQPQAWYEWKKLAPHLEQKEEAQRHEPNWVFGLQPKVALSDGGGA